MSTEVSRYTWLPHTVLSATVLSYSPQSWILIGRNDAEAETPVLWPSHAKNWLFWKESSPWCWGRLRAGGQGDNRGWDGWMASPTQWTWVWVNSGSWWWTGRPDVLQFMGSQRVRHDWATELNWTFTSGKSRHWPWYSSWVSCSLGISNTHSHHQGHPMYSNKYTYLGLISKSQLLRKSVNNNQLNSFLLKCMC